MARDTSDSLPGPIRDSFVATVNPRQQRSIDGRSRETVWCERHLDDALATRVGYTVFLVASFRRLALLDVLHCISCGVARRQSIWSATEVCNQRMHDERRWLVWRYGSFCAAVA